MSHLTSSPAPHRNALLTQGRTPIERARNIQRTLGTRPAAAYLRNRGWSLEATRYILLGV
jgi:hypothetical protein